MTTTSNTRRTTAPTVVAALLLLAALLLVATSPSSVDGFSLKQQQQQQQQQSTSASASASAASASTTATSTTSTSTSTTATRRDFFSKIVTTTTTTAAVAAAGVFLATTTANPSPAVAAAASTSTAGAAPQIYNLPSGIKYAVLKDTTKTKGGYPQPGDIIAIEYTGYLTSGQIFDASHSEGKNNALLFKLGSTAVIPGINEMVSEMKVGQKVQAIVPPSSAFKDKGICLDDGECLVKPGSTLVYDIYLKKASIPPP